MSSRALRALMAAGLVAAPALGALPASAVPSRSAAAPGDCLVKPGNPIGDTWPQRRLDFQQVWGITQGAGVTVAVIDSGVNFVGPQLRGIEHSPGTSVIPAIDRRTRDCDGHGTAVAGIIAAQPEPDATFVGVAPDARIVPIKQTMLRTDNSGTPAGLAAGIRAAVAAHAQVINISIAIPRPDPGVAKAIGDADARGIVIVAAAGNDGQQTRSMAYPAAYSTTFDNVIAVSATGSDDAVADFSSAGGYVTVAAPGKDVPAPATGGGYVSEDGTSFAAPYVTGTVALMLAADTGHRLTPTMVRDRLEATADAPPADVPDPKYGYGIVNPYLAVTAVDSAPVAGPRSVRPSPLPAPQAAAPADRDLQHLALGLAFGLIGIAVLAVVAAAILRGGGRRARPVPAGSTDDSRALVRR